MSLTGEQRFMVQRLVAAEDLPSHPEWADAPAEVAQEVLRQRERPGPLDLGDRINGGTVIARRVCEWDVNEAIIIVFKPNAGNDYVVASVPADRWVREWINGNYTDDIVYAVRRWEERSRKS